MESYYERIHRMEELKGKWKGGIDGNKVSPRDGQSSITDMEDRREYQRADYNHDQYKGRDQHPNWDYKGHHSHSRDQHPHAGTITSCVQHPDATSSRDRQAHGNGNLYGESGEPYRGNQTVGFTQGAGHNHNQDNQPGYHPPRGQTQGSTSNNQPGTSNPSSKQGTKGYDGPGYDRSIFRKPAVDRNYPLPQDGNHVPPHVPPPGNPGGGASHPPPPGLSDDLTDRQAITDLIKGRPVEEVNELLNLLKDALTSAGKSATSSVGQTGRGGSQSSDPERHNQHPVGRQYSDQHQPGKALPGITVNRPYTRDVNSNYRDDRDRGFVDVSGRDTGLNRPYTSDLGPVYSDRFRDRPAYSDVYGDSSRDPISNRDRQFSDPLGYYPERGRFDDGRFDDPRYSHHTDIRELSSATDERRDHDNSRYDINRDDNGPLVFASYRREEAHDGEHLVSNFDRGAALSHRERYYYGPSPPPHLHRRDHGGTCNNNSPQRLNALTDTNWRGRNASTTGDQRYDNTSSRHDDNSSKSFSNNRYDQYNHRGDFGGGLAPDYAASNSSSDNSRDYVAYTHAYVNLNYSSVGNRYGGPPPNNSNYNNTGNNYDTGSYGGNIIIRSHNKDYNEYNNSSNNTAGAKTGAKGGYGNTTDHGGYHHHTRNYTGGGYGNTIMGYNIASSDGYSGSYMSGYSGYGGTGKRGGYSTARLRPDPQARRREHHQERVREKDELLMQITKHIGQPGNTMPKPLFFPPHPLHYNEYEGTEILLHCRGMPARYALCQLVNTLFINDFVMNDEVLKTFFPKDRKQHGLICAYQLRDREVILKKRFVDVCENVENSDRPKLDNQELDFLEIKDLGDAERRNFLTRDTEESEVPLHRNRQWKPTASNTANLEVYEYLRREQEKAFMTFHWEQMSSLTPKDTSPRENTTTSTAIDTTTSTPDAVFGMNATDRVRINVIDEDQGKPGHHQYGGEASESSKHTGGSSKSSRSDKSVDKSSKGKSFLETEKGIVSMTFSEALSTQAQSVCNSITMGWQSSINTAEMISRKNSYSRPDTTVLPPENSESPTLRSKQSSFDDKDDQRDNSKEPRVVHVTPNFHERALTGPWLSKCRGYMHSKVSQKIDPRVAQFIDFCYLPRHFESNANMGSLHLRFRSVHIANRWRKVMTGARFPGSSEKELLIYGRGKSQRTAKKQKHVPPASSPRPSIGSSPAAMNSSTTADPQDHSATSLRSSVSGALGEPATTSGSRALLRRGSNNTGEDDDNYHEGDRDSDNGSDFEDRYHNIIPSYKKFLAEEFGQSKFGSQDEILFGHTNRQRNRWWFDHESFEVIEKTSKIFGRKYVKL